MCIFRTSDEHHTNREDLFCISVRRHVAKAHAGQTAQGEVERSNIDAPDGRSIAGAVAIY